LISNDLNRCTSQWLGNSVLQEYGFPLRSWLLDMTDEPTLRGPQGWLQTSW